VVQIGLGEHSLLRHPGESRDPGATGQSVCLIALDPGFRRDDGCEMALLQNASDASRRKAGMTEKEKPHGPDGLGEGTMAPWGGIA
jgi:hypothetical protein